MNRRDFLKLAGQSGVYFSISNFLLNACSRPKKRPNILFIMSDDHAGKAISCYGGELNQTPNIDRLAEQGMRFNRCFCTNSLCAPSRAVILTGKHSHINGQIDNGRAFDGSQQTFPKLLQQHGYQTAMIGKWHLGSEPTGFDYWNILPGQGSYYNPDFIEMGEKKRVAGYVTDLITDFALDWLDRRDRSKNYCLMLQYKAPHRNWMPHIKYLDLYQDTDIPLPDNLFDDFRTRSAALKEQEINIKSDLFLDYDFKVPYPVDSDELSEEERLWQREWIREYNRMTDEQQRAWDAAYQDEIQAFRRANLTGKELIRWKFQRFLKDYLRCIASVDENIGRVLDYLKENNLEENTIVIYTSDQGFFLGEHGLFDKRFMYEESLKMPFIVRYPEEISPGVNDTELVQNLDFAPTLLDYAGVKIPADMQGCSMRKILAGHTPADWRDAIYYHFYEYPGIGRVKRHYGVRTRRYKLIHFYYDIDAWEMYDLEKDPHEMNNVFQDPAYAEIRHQLEKKLQQLRVQYRDTDIQRYLPKPAIQVNHKALGCPVLLKYPPAKKYSGGNPNALTDGWLAPDQINGFNEHKVWQGFEQVDLEAVIDLQQPTEISSVRAGFLQQISAWIFMPQQVKFQVSNDGRQFVDLAVVDNPIPERETNPIRYEFKWQGKARTVRYLKVVAKNRGTCPDWHKGAGGKAWLFADEIVVK